MYHVKCGAAIPTMLRCPCMKSAVYPPLAPDWPDTCFDTRAAVYPQPKSCLGRKRREFTTAISFIGKMRRARMEECNILNMTSASFHFQSSHFDFDLFLSNHPLPIPTRNLHLDQMAMPPMRPPPSQTPYEISERISRHAVRKLISLLVLRAPPRQSSHNTAAG